MGDSTDGSSSAAQSALGKEPNQNRGFFSRIFKTNTAVTYLDVNGHEGEQPDIPEGGLGNLQRMRVVDVAVPRADITGVALDESLDDVIKAFRSSGYSRLPVYDDVLDNPVGFIHLKDLTLKIAFAKRPPKFNMKRMMRPLLFAPPSMPIGILLQKMQTERIHMALVIDEYGGVDGLLTIEDLIEQVVGEITDEHDTEEATAWTQETDGSYLVQARANLEEFEKVLGVDFLSDTDDEDIDTLGGFVFMLIGRVPARGEVIQHNSGYEFEVLDADPRRIKRLRMTKTNTKG